MPFRKFGELIGSISWDAQDRAATLKTVDKTVVFYVDKGIATVNGKEYDADSRIIDGSTYVPFEFLTKRLYMRVERGLVTVVKKSLKETQWESSPHATLVQYPAKQDGCVSCHTYQGFALEITKVAEIQDPQPQICATCHGEAKRQLNRSGFIKLPSGVEVDAGKAAVCTSCHNARRSPSISKANLNAPHAGPQADLLFGFGAEVPGEKYASSSHLAAPNACVSCHMAEGPGEEIGGHTFMVARNGVENTTGCHGGACPT